MATIIDECGIGANIDVFAKNLSPANVRMRLDVFPLFTSAVKCITQLFSFLPMYTICVYLFMQAQSLTEAFDAAELPDKEV